MAGGAVQSAIMIVNNAAVSVNFIFLGIRWKGRAGVR